jgi:adenine-specific DNA methylase
MFLLPRLVIGVFTKQDVIKWADQVIESSSNQYPYELIDVSLSSAKSKEEVASILKGIYGEDRLNEPLYRILGFLYRNLLNKTLNEEDLFTYFYRLQLQSLVFLIEENIISELDRLSDDYYLATQGIYGYKDEVVQEALEFLKQYDIYFEDNLK